MSDIARSLVVGEANVRRGHRRGQSGPGEMHCIRLYRNCMAPRWSRECGVKGSKPPQEKGAARPLREDLARARGRISSRPVSSNPAAPPRRGGLNIGRKGRTVDRSQLSFAAIDSISETS
jgi:hypothetical protein